MTTKQFIGLFVVIFGAVLVANLLTLKIAAQQVQSSATGAAGGALGLLGTLLGGKG